MGTGDNPEYIDKLANENACLRALTAGEDDWPRFMQLFGKCIYIELTLHGVPAGDQRDDILQELALRLMEHDWRIIRRFIKRDLGYSFKALLRKVINAAVQNYRRRHRNWNQKVALESTQFDRAQDHGDPARIAENKARESALLLKVIGDNDNQEAYRILYLRFIEGESVNDIARELESTPNAISQRLRYYRQRARAILGREVEP